MSSTDGNDEFDPSLIEENDEAPHALAANPDDLHEAQRVSAEAYLARAAEEASPEVEAMGDAGGVELVYTPLFPQEMPPDIVPNLAPQADDARRLLIARMLSPLPPRELVLTLYALIADANPAIRQSAESSFEELPPPSLRSVLAGHLPAKVFDYIARVYFSDDDPDRLLETMLLNPALGDDTLLLLARVGAPKLLDLIINNQTRLMKTPQVLRDLPKNPRITVAQLSRALEFGRRQKLVSPAEETELIDRFLGKQTAAAAAAPETIKVLVEKTVTPIVNEEGETDFLFPTFLTADFEMDMGLDANAAVIESKIKSQLNMRDFVRTLSVPQKIRLAVRGNMEARKILIEDSLALVAREVLKNPRLTKTEVERAAGSRMIDPEVIELIAKSATFTRSYAVRISLVMNPKTPLRWSSRLLFTLFERDIKTIAKSKAVPGAVSSIARQKLEAQEERRKKSQKKKKK